MRFTVGQKIVHETYGVGIITAKWLSKKRTENYAVIFPSGGPQGWADKATHDVNDLLPFSEKVN